ncbi:MAG: holo-ACP synthase [Nitrospirota bacterium]
MIYGIGIDIVRIARVEQAMAKWGERFLARVYTEGEIAYCNERKNPYRSLAARFAAKEAFIKAIGGAAPLSLTDIEVANSEKGKPFIRLEGKLAESVKKKGITRMHLSLSHEQDYAVACVVLESL